MNDQEYMRLAQSGAIRTYMQDKRRSQRVRRMRIAAAVLLTMAAIAAIAYALP